MQFGYNKYPKEVEKCFYCNQKLPDENKKLIKKLHAIVENEYQKKIDDIIVILNEYNNKINLIIEKDYTKYKMFKFRRVRDLYDVSSRKKINLNQCLNICLSSDYLNDINNYVESNLNKEEIRGDYYLSINKFIKVCLENEIERDEQKYLELKNVIQQIEQIKQKAQEKLNKIKDTEYLIRSKKEIKKIISKIDLLLQYKENISDFKGLRTKVSKSKSRYEEKEIWKSYKDMFNDYLDKFEIPESDKIKRKFSNPSSKSHVDTKIEVEGETYPTGEILSEGEAKIHSLCDLLTELEFDDIGTLILDDPITSLDHRYIEMFSDVIVELATRYQVIVFTHSMEFYQELITKSLGNGAVEKPKCGICELDDSHKSENHCHGYKPNDEKVYKCGSYYQLETVIQPGIVKDEIDFLRMNYEQRLSKIRSKILKGDKSNLSVLLRTTINNFYEHYVLGNIKKVVFKGEDLLTHKNNIRVREFDDKDYDILKKLHSKLSARSNLHETSIQNKTPIDLKGLISIYNELVDTIQKYQSHVGEKIVGQQSK